MKTDRSYSDFLSSKQRVDPATGLADLPDICPALFPFQADIVRWALRRGRAGLFAGTGLGKTLMELAWGDAIHRATGGNVIHLAPLAVAAQIIREAEKFGIPARHVKTQADCGPGINVTNYQKLDHFDLAAFQAVILDECFASDTPIDVVDERGKCSQKHIKDVRIGDRIVNASGTDLVSDVHCREVPYAVRVRYAGKTILASPNHPFLTQRGWVGAQDLVPGDTIVSVHKAMRMVRDRIRGRASTSTQEAVLQSILLSEMADAPAGASGKGAQSDRGSEARATQAGLARQRRSQGRSGDHAHHRTQPNVAARGSREALAPVEGGRARTFRAWGQRAWFDSAAAGFDGCAARELEGGICLVTGPTNSRLSYALQARLGERRNANSYRGGWSLTSFAGGARPQEGGSPLGSRVDGIEVLELGHPELDQYRDADGKLYFYDLGGTRHPSFSIHGCLVHNSSILKSIDGHYRKRLIRECDRIPFRLAATATPAPNDFMELGNHAEFLGVMSYTDMLATFFVHDGGETQKWRLKGHAEDAFWQWMASWSVMLRKPSDLGYEDGAYLLPELRQVQHTVHAAYAPSMETGLLFPMQAVTMQERLAARRDTVAERVALAAKLTPSDRQFVWWCNLNAESEALAKAIPGAVEVRGSDTEEEKERRLLGFVDGTVRVLVTKPSLAGFGMNFQCCADTGFVGLNDSFEQIYQAVRRFWRFGQQQPVTAHFIAAETEGAVVANLRRKEESADRMVAAMVRHMSDFSTKAVRGSERERADYQPTQPLIIPSWIGEAA